MSRPACWEMRLCWEQGSSFVCDKTEQKYDNVEATFSPFHFDLILLFTSSPTNRHRSTDHDSWSPEGEEIRCVMCDMCDKVKTTMGALNLSERLLLRCEETDHLWYITFREKRMWWDSQRFVKKCDIDVTAWQAPTVSEHYWSIVPVSRSESFCRQPHNIVSRGEAGWDADTRSVTLWWETQATGSGLLPSFGTLITKLTMTSWQGFLLL